MSKGDHLRGRQPDCESCAVERMVDFEFVALKITVRLCCFDVD